MRKFFSISCLIFISGCNTPPDNNRSREYFSSNEFVVNTGSVYEARCQTFADEKNKLVAFYGLKVNNYKPVVNGFYYCGLRSPAEEAGVKVGDIVLKIRNCETKTSSDVELLVKHTAPQSLVVMEVLRNKQPVNISVRVMAYYESYSNRETTEKINNCHLYDGKSMSLNKNRRIQN